METRMKDGNLCHLEDTTVKVGIDRRTGIMRSVVFKARQADLFRQLRGGIPGYAGGLRIFDEYDRKWYSDLDTPSTLGGFAATRAGIAFVKRFAGAPFTLQVSFSLSRGFLRWAVEARKVRSALPDRSLRVHFQMPGIPGWNVWAPCRGGQDLVFDGLTTFNFEHVQTAWVSDFEVILPMMSHYDPAADLGYTMLNPIDAKVPASRFLFSNAERGFNWGNFAKAPEKVPHLELCNYYIGLVGDRPMRTEMMLAFHGGCWRPALGQVFRRWKRYFIPPNPAMYDMEGVFHCTGVKDLYVKEAARAHLKTYEVHEHFAYYGKYHHREAKWFRNAARESLWRVFGGRREGVGDRRCGKDAWEIEDWIAAHSDREIAAKVMEDPRYQKAERVNNAFRDPRNKDVSTWTDEEVDEFLYHTRERIRRVLRDCRRHGIFPFWYFNYTDGFRPAMERDFSDALTAAEDGTLTSSGWQMCHNMNSDPRYAFGRALLAEVDRIVKDYPEICGFFLDCFRHYEIDFRHDDGITVVNHKPAYSMAFSYDEINAKAMRKLHRRGMASFANKPQSLRIMRWVDGMMLEGNGDQFEEKFFWTAIAKPIIFLWGDTMTSVDENYRRSVLHGCFPKMVAKDAAGIRHLEEYLPLFAQFKRRVFCFEPDPLRVPRGSRGRLFTVGNDYLAGIVNLDLERGDRIRHRKPPLAIFRVGRGHDIGKVGIMHPGDRDFRTADFTFDGTFVFVPMPAYVNCAVVRLFVTRRSGRQIAMRPFPRNLQLCNDPESAFTSLATL